MFIELCFCSVFLCFFFFLFPLFFAYLMDSSSQIFGGKYEEGEGGEEECHSSESGWTMYIGSPIDDHDEEDEENQEEVGGDGDDDDNCDSDDSMVSDASSRMALASKDNLKGKENDEKKLSKGKKMAVEKNGYEERKGKRGGVTSVVPAQSGNKVRRNRIGKKK